MSSRAEKNPGAQFERFIDQLRKFVREPRSGELPTVYIATRQEAGFGDYPERSESAPKLYRVDESFTIDQLMKVVYPFRDYADYHDLQKAEEFVMPGFDMYVMTQDLDGPSQQWSFAEELAGPLTSLFYGCDVDQELESVLGDGTSKDNDKGGGDQELQTMTDGMGKAYAVLAPIFMNSGPMGLPHYHVNVCIGLDSYAPGWLGLESYQTEGTEDAGKSKVELFNERFGKHGLRWGRILTVRYRSYKPGILQAVSQQFSELAMEQEGYVAEQIETRVEEAHEKLVGLGDIPGFREYLENSEKPQTDQEVSEADVLRGFISQNGDRLSSDQRILVKDVITEVDDLLRIGTRVAEVAMEIFGVFTGEHFQMTLDEFEAAYQRKIDWLGKNIDQAVVGAAHRLGLTPMIRKKAFDGWRFRPVSLTDFAPGGVVLTQTEDERLNNAVVDMVVAHPVPFPIEDRETIATFQMGDVVDKLIESSNGLVLCDVDEELRTVVDDYVITKIKFSRQVQELSMEDLVAGKFEKVNDTTERIYVRGYDKQNRSVVDQYLAAVHEKIMRQRDSKPGIKPAVVVFAKGSIEPETANQTWIKEGSVTSRLEKSGRQLTSRKFGEASVKSR